MIIDEDNVLIKHGKGLIVYPNGDKYDGDWLNDSRSGFGVQIYVSNEDELGGEYKGQWLNDRHNG